MHKHAARAQIQAAGPKHAYRVLAARAGVHAHEHVRGVRARDRRARLEHALEVGLPEALVDGRERHAAHLGVYEICAHVLVIPRATALSRACASRKHARHTPTLARLPETREAHPTLAQQCETACTRSFCARKQHPTLGPTLVQQCETPRARAYPGGPT